MQLPPFALERAYREWFRPGLIDLSSSAASSPSLSSILSDRDIAGFGRLPMGYEPGGGSRELRAAVAALYRGLAAENVLVTAGASEAIRAAAMALVKPGQCVLVQEPSYQALSHAVLDAGGSAVPLRARYGSLQFDLRDMDGADDIDLAFLNSPYGPGGSLVRGIESFRGRAVVDEVYRPIALTPRPLPSSVDLAAGAVAIGDLSKPLGLGGLRFGWIASKDAKVIEQCAAALDYLSGSISTLSAAVATEVLPKFAELLAPHLGQARRNLLHLTRFVEVHRAWLDWSPPQAGYTACLKLRAGAQQPKLFARLRARGVFLLPGEVFGLDDCLRIGLGLPEETFVFALELLGEEIRRLAVIEGSTAARPDVILYTKLPRPGHGKSRLAAGVGAERASLLAAAFLEDTLDLVRREAGRLFVSVPPSDALPEFVSGLPEARVYEQRGQGMGERLAGAFEGAFTRGARNPVLIGSDSPTLPGHLLAVASLALQSHDVVLGPALDGGYYAIGLRKPAPRLFEGIDWSTDRVLTQTVGRAAACGMDVFFLPSWYDIDTGDDLQLLRRDLRPGSATHDVLAGLL